MRDTIGEHAVLTLSRTSASTDVVRINAPTASKIIMIHNGGPLPFRLNGYAVPVGESRRFRRGSRRWYICAKRPGQWGDLARMKRARRMKAAEQSRIREQDRRADQRQPWTMSNRRSRRAFAADMRLESGSTAPLSNLL